MGGNLRHAFRVHFSYQTLMGQTLSQNLTATNPVTKPAPINTNLPAPSSYSSNKYTLSQSNPPLFSTSPIFPSQTPSLIPPLNVQLSYKNNASIKHDYGVSGIAPLKSKSDDKLIIPVIITWPANPPCQTVYVTGSFNNWKQKIRLTKSNNDFTTVIDLLPGTHKLKFIVDDEWKCNSDLAVSNDDDGNLVNCIDVVDEIGSNLKDGFGDLLNPDTKEPEPDDFESIIPSYLLVATKKGDPRLPVDNPPQLPKQCEKVLLNLSVDDADFNILSVPNHVVLNHLYACSIRDGVIALSCTSRYRKKFVTSVYYRPIGKAGG